MKRMPWTRIKSLLRDRLAPALRNRVAVHQARYRHSREELGRIWVQLDEREIAAFSTAPAVRRRRELTDELMNVNNSWGSTEAFGKADRIAQSLMSQAGEQSDYTAWDDLESYLSLSIDDALSSSNPLIRALAIADRRVGKRRLQTLRIGSREHVLVREIFAIRCEVEGVAIASPDV
jgi:hypothetical protein